MKKKHWHLILESDMKAPMSGIYVFSIRSDNHLSYECHKMNEGDSFYAAAGSPYNDPTRWFVPHSISAKTLLAAATQPSLS